MEDRRAEVRAYGNLAQTGIKIIAAAIECYEEYKHGGMYSSGELEGLERTRSILRQLNIAVNTLIMSEEIRLDS